MILQVPAVEDDNICDEWEKQKAWTQIRCYITWFGCPTSLFFCIKYVVIYGPLGRRSCGLWVFLMNLELFLSKSNIGIAPEFVWIE